MKKTILPFALLALSLIACDPCRNLDCLASTDYRFFRLVSATGGQDLLFGNSRLYRPEELKFYSVANGDTTYYPQRAEKPYVPGMDSALFVSFRPVPATAYLRLPNGDVDTFAISSRSYNTRCCGQITEITDFRINGLNSQPVQGVQTLQK
ncbi:MAG TPA: hypothetical protein VHK69_06800 [Chitinophagaceae bacterium]|jgi:hypothetical protein|nr:hypothetical protein [Chitinophagaceae bacterium]